MFPHNNWLLWEPRNGCLYRWGCSSRCLPALLPSPLPLSPVLCEFCFLLEESWETGQDQIRAFSLPSGSSEQEWFRACMLTCQLASAVRVQAWMMCSYVRWTQLETEGEEKQALKEKLMEREDDELLEMKEKAVRSWLGDEVNGHSHIKGQIWEESTLGRNQKILIQKGTYRCLWIQAEFQDTEAKLSDNKRGLWDQHQRWGINCMRLIQC